MRKLIFISYLFALTLIHSIANAQNQEWSVTNSNVKFKIKNAGFTVDGTFGAIAAKINFDATKPKGNSIEANVDVKTVNTGNGKRDGHLKKPDYFNADKFPLINIKTNLIVKESEGKFKALFSVTIKDKTKDILIPFTFTEKDNKAAFAASFNINRLDFGVGESSLILSDNAIVSVEINVIKK